jgi:hypothetical protein
MGLMGSQPEANEPSPVVSRPQAASESAAIQHLARTCAAAVPQQCSNHPLMKLPREAPLMKPSVSPLAIATAHIPSAERPHR